MTFQGLILEAYAQTLISCGFEGHSAKTQGHFKHFSLSSYKKRKTVEAFLFSNLGY